MKSLSQIKQTLQDKKKISESEQLDELKFKTATDAFAARAKKGDEKKLDKDRSYIKKRWGDAGVRLAGYKTLEEMNQAFSLPMVLLLRRKTIRNFSDGTAVALYYNDRINRYFTIPVRNVPHPENEPIQVGEEIQCDTNFDALQLLSEDIEVPLTFTDGSTMQVDKDTATKVLMMYTQLNESNQLKFLENIDNRVAFDKIIAFVQK